MTNDIISHECTALVTGGSGVLGRHLTRALVARGYRVRIFDLASPPEEDPQVDFFRGDVADAPSVSDACRGCDAVFHLAARMPQARLSPEEFRRVNVGGARNVAEACVRHQVKTLVFASSIEIYGPRTDFPIAEDAPKFFTGIYSRNKAECEQLLLDYRARHGLHASMLRMPLVLGPGFYHEKTFIEMMRRVRRGKRLPLTGGADIPFIAVAASDAADAFVAAAETEAASGEAFNIAAVRAEPTRGLFARFIREVGSKSRIAQVPRRIMSPLISVAVKLNLTVPFLDTPAELLPFALTGGDFDISKARRLLGYDPKKDCLAALVETYRWLIDVGRI